MHINFLIPSHIYEVIMRIDNKACMAEYRMPAEYDRHKATIMIWPVRPGSWPNGGVKAKEVFTEIARHIARHEELIMVASKEYEEEAKSYLLSKDNEADSDLINKNIKIVIADTNDAWARDTSPIFVKKLGDNKDVRGVNFTFNAWGGDYDGLYAHWEEDDKLAINICNELGYDYFDAAPFVLEGGSIHTDGKGTLIATESCLLSPGRNPKLSKPEIEEVLKKTLGMKKIIWIPYGIYNDETNEHVDNVCAFTSEANVVLAWTDKEDEPQYAMSMADLKVLENETDCDGLPLKVHKLYIPDIPVTIKEEDLEGYEFEEGEDERELGERLAASYANFYIANGIALVPQFNDKKDADAIALLQALMPDRKVIGIYARDIIVGGGNIHCITMQIPE